MHRYRTHTCGALRDTRYRRDRASVGLGASHARPWRRAVHRPARPLRPDPVVADPDRPAFKDAEKLRAEWVIRIDGKVRRRPAGTENPDLPTGAVEVYHHRDRGAGAGGRAADAGVRRPGISGGDPAQIPLPRSAPRAAASQHHASAAQIIDSIRRRMKEQGFFEFQTPILTASSPGGRARLPGAVAAASGQVLRAAAGAAAVQAAHHDRGLRPLFPDRAVLPRRGRARRPLARRVLSARHRDELRHPGRRVRRGRAGDARRVRGVRRRQAGDAEVPADPLSPTRCANTAPTSRTCATRSRCRTSPRSSAAPASRSSRGMIEASPKSEVWAIPAPGGGSRAFCDRMNDWAQGEGQPGPRLHLLASRARQSGGRGPIAKNIGPERTERSRAQARARSRRRGVLRRRQAGDSSPSSPGRRAPRSARSWR